MANISHFTQTVGGVSVTYDIHDANAIPRSGGAVMSGAFLARTIASSALNLYGGPTWDKGANIAICGAENSGIPGVVKLQPRLSSSTYKDMHLYPNGTWTWEGTACQITSDQRLKQQITEIDDKLLDAWEDVELAQFKYNDAVDQKKDKARLHTGYVVQPQETEEVEVEQKDGTKTKETKVIREASEHYSLRYTEVYAVECMYLRRCIARLTARIEELEKGNNIK